MTSSIELQVICKLLTSENSAEVDKLCSYDESFYAIFNDEIKFILNHREQYGDVPDVFTFQAQFPEFTMVQVSESLEYLVKEICKNKSIIVFRETFNKLRDLGTGDVSAAWEYLSSQCEIAASLHETPMLDLVKDAELRSNKVIEFNQQARIPTGFSEIDKLMYGGLSTVEELLLIVARTNTGKAQPLWSKVLTPKGWVTMGDIKIGDIVIGKDNDNGKVVQIYPQGIKEYYRISFDDGTYAKCCDDHLWEVFDGEKYNVLTTREMRNNSDTVYSVDISEMINYDVESAVSRNEGYEFGLSVRADNNIIIPKSHFLSSVHTREAIVSGILGIEGCNLYKSRHIFISATKRLAYDFAELVRSIGGKVKICCDEGKYVCNIVFNVDNIRQRKNIVSIDFVGRTECQCILLNNKSHTYITDFFTVTHNSWVCTKMMESAHANGFPVLYYSPEMQGAFLGTRFDTWKAHFQNSKLFQGKYDDAYIEYIKTLTTNNTSAYILEDKDVSGGEVTASVLRTLVKQYGIKLLIIDGLSYMSDGRKSETDYVKYKNICMDLFKLSKQFGCAVVVALQANRETKDTKDDKGEPFPNLYNIEGSDHPARIATQAFALRQVFDKHVLDIRMEKSRNANNQKPVLSYAWDVNTGNAQYLPGEDDISDMSYTNNTQVDVSSVMSGERKSDVDDALSEDFKEVVEF